jgi:hypothetical protein
MKENSNPYVNNKKDLPDKTQNSENWGFSSEEFLVL